MEEKKLTEEEAFIILLTKLKEARKRGEKEGYVSNEEVKEHFKNKIL